MTLRSLVDEAEKLPPNEKWELVDELLRMTNNERADIALTPAQSADLERRMEEARSGREKLIPCDEAVAMLKKRG